MVHPLIEGWNFYFGLFRFGKIENSEINVENGALPIRRVEFLFWVGSIQIFKIKISNLTPKK